MLESLESDRKKLGNTRKARKCHSERKPYQRKVKIRKVGATYFKKITKKLKKN